MSALSAWFWVDALTFRSVASHDRKLVIARAPISSGWRLSWKIT